jgi:hypothetical protein
VIEKGRREKERKERQEKERAEREKERVVVCVVSQVMCVGGV